ncbi:tyrosine-type recombinase/integrase [Rhizobium tumorigenes]|uniref:Tyrosine-type recombinase/integrase n=1 Tax=Rhizobium tumorigenes TaxID=2041385 RepID=A0AAF1KST7_9HYPH|nr:tyrosine-type recombinase/integrase [Rhizobium tumorigenes]WFR96295.1 tyrosine-type recombinase/integrase [Rhizobium tumorigenes]
MAGVRGKPNRHIRLKGTKYQFKIGVPADCRDYFKGQQNYVESTGTGDLMAARRWRDRREREMVDLFRDIRSGRLVPDTLSDALLRAQLSREAYVAEQDPDVRSQIEESVGQMRDALGRKPVAQASFDNAWQGKADVDAHVEQWLSEINLAPKTTLDYRSILKRLAAWSKEKGLSIVEINVKIAGQYVTGELLNPAKMTRVTAKKHLGAIAGYWEHLRTRGHVSSNDKNPWEGQIPKARGKQGVIVEVERPFTDSELESVLYKDAFSKRGGGKLDWNDELKELALISVLSGMRLAEITDLTVAACADGMFDQRKSKTKAGLRVVPIHSKLVAIITRRCKGREPAGLLFEEFMKLGNPSDTLSKAFTRRRKSLGVSEKREGFRRSLVNFHSFRRTFATKARHADIPEATIQDVIGHETGEKKSLLRSRYAKDASWEQKVNCVEAVKVPCKQ